MGKRGKGDDDDVDELPDKCELKRKWREGCKKGKSMHLLPSFQ